MPSKYKKNSIKYILGSPTTVVYLSEIETSKKGVDVRYTTISGTTVFYNYPDIEEI